MTFGLFPEEVQAARGGGVLMDRPPAGFWSGGGDLAMQGLAKTARAVDLLGAIPAILEDKFTGGTSSLNPLRLREGVTTEAQDRYFREHDEVFNRAVDYWTPEPGTVGKAGQVVGSLVPVIAQVLTSPALAIGTAGLGTGEDLIREGVPAKKAVAAAVAQAVGLGAGIAMPFFGSTLATRALLGAGTNVAQGVATKAVTQQILKGEKAAEQYDPWEIEGVVIDALMGLAFGGIAHLGAKGQEARDTMLQSDRDAILVAQQARHLEDTTLPGKPADEVSRTAHVEAVKKAADDLLAGRPVTVDQIVQDARFEPDAARAALATEIHDAAVEQARQTVLETIAAEQARTRAEETPAFLRTAEDLIALRPAEVREMAPDLQRAVEIAKKPAALRTPEERIFLKSALEGNAFDALTKPIEPLSRDVPSVEQAVRQVADAAGVKVDAAPDPLLTEARQRLSEHGERPITIVDDKGNVLGTKTMTQIMDDASNQTKFAQQAASLFQTAAACMIGGL